MAATLSGRGFSPPFPNLVQGKRETVKRPRDAFEHIDERAHGRIEGGAHDVAEAHTVFTNNWYGVALADTREIAYRGWKLGIDGEATELLVALRTYLRAVWSEVFVR